MGIDTAPARYRTATTEQSWPKCRVCTVRMQGMRKLDREALGIDIPYPVEGLKLVTRERPRDMRSKYRWVIEAQCHGQMHRFTVEIPPRFGDTGEQVVLGLIDCFIPNGKGGYNVELNPDRMRSMRYYRDLLTSVR